MLSGDSLIPTRSHQVERPPPPSVRMPWLWIILAAISCATGQQWGPAQTDAPDLSDLSYSELLSLNTSCSPKDTCLKDLFKSRDLTSVTDRNCACDDACVTYGDCCIDAPARTLMGITTSPKQNGWVCQNLTQFGGIVMKNTCPSNWSGPPSVREKCGALNTENSGEDPISAMPVTNRVTGTTYMNLHCAFCNGDVTDTVVWQPRLEFNTLNQYNNTFQNITGEYIMQNLQYDSTAGKWGVQLTGQDYMLYYYYAQLYPVMPKEVENLVRPCRKSLISSCLPEWTNLTVEAKCFAYEAAIYQHNIMENRAFRNPHCAICNNVELESLTCRAPTGKAEIEQRTFNFQSFSLILDFNDAKGGQVGKQDLCSGGMVYDPFQKQCRNIVCGFPGYIFKNGKCVLEKKKNTTTTTSITSTTTTSTTTSTTTTPAPVIETTITDSPDIQTTKASSPDISDLTKDRPIIYPTEGTTMNPQIEYDITTIGNEVEDVTEVDSKHKSRSDDIKDVTMTPFTTASVYNEDFIQCPKVSVPADMVQALPNGTIYIIPYDKEYDPTNYLISGNVVLVCAFFINETQAERVKFSIVFGYITVVGLSISMFCLILHLVVYMIVPDLQNLSTRNLSSLALSLFFAYFCFIIGNISSLSIRSCVTLAVATAFFFLVSFFWMNTMSYDVWRTLRLATKELRVSSGRQWNRFLLYSLYSWAAPAAIMAAAVVVDNVNGVPNDYKPGFGKNHMCWFTERKALLIFFASPLVAIMVANIGFFISSAKMILSTTQATASNFTASSRRNFKLYLRLGIMMGLTWAFGLLAGYLNLETLWYVFVLLNTLQGLFIFVAFTCNRKVKKYLMDKYQSFRKGRHAYRSSSLNSGSAFNSNSTFPSSAVGGNKTASSQMSDTKSTPTSSLTSTPIRAPTSFKHLQAGMETLY